MKTINDIINEYNDLINYLKKNKLDLTWSEKIDIGYRLERLKEKINTEKFNIIFWRIEKLEEAVEILGGTKTYEKDKTKNI